MKPEDFAVKETKEEQSFYSSIDGVHSENVKPGENHLLSNVCSLQHRVNNLNIVQLVSLHMLSLALLSVLFSTLRVRSYDFLQKYNLTSS